MIPKLWSLLMLKLSRLIVKIDTARDADEAVRQVEMILEEMRANDD